VMFNYTPPLPVGGEDCGEGAFLFISPHPGLLPSQGEGIIMRNKI
jgi:hypothetical protein